MPRDSFEKIKADWLAATKGCDLTRSKRGLPSSKDWRDIWWQLAHEHQEAEALAARLSVLARRAMRQAMPRVAFGRGDSFDELLIVAAELTPEEWEWLGRVAGGALARALGLVAEMPGQERTES